MTFIEAILLGIIQGLTEFLPVSSSGHLELAKAILGNEFVGEESLTFTVVLHFATALSTMVVFRKEVVQIVIGLFKFRWNEELRFSLKILVSMVPAVIVGLLFEDKFEVFFDGQIVLVGFMLIITSLLLLFADKAQNTLKSVSFFNAFVVGISQALAILPGMSRSGATIASSVLLGVDRTKAARFSFLMVVPLIFGKIGKDMMSGSIDFQSAGFSSLVVGFIASFIAGLFACNWMVSLVKKSRLFYFAGYCFVVGILAIFITLYL